MKTLKTDLQSQIKREVKNLSNSELIVRFKVFKAEQQDTLSVALSMALAQVITVYKREFIDRGIDYLAI